MKSTFFIFALLLKVVVFAQDTLKFTDEASFLEYTFDAVSSSAIKTGILVNRNLDSTDGIITTTEMPTSAINNNIFNVDDWLMTYNTLWSGTRTGSPQLSLLQDILEPHFDGYFKTRLDEDLTIPIMILDFDVNQMKSSAVEDGNLIVSNGQYVDGFNPAAGFLEKRIICAAPFIDTVYSSNVFIDFSNDNFYTNRSDVITHFKLIIGNDSIKIFPEDVFDITPYLETNHIFQLQIFYESGYRCATFFELIQRKKLPARTREIEEWDEFNTIVGEEVDLTWGLILGCGNTDIEKPLIFVSGYAPWIPVSQTYDFINGYIGNPSVGDFFDKFNILNLMENAHAAGFDIIVVSYTPPHSSVMLNGDLLVELIQQVNQRKFANNSYQENTIIGYSAGGLAAKYALDKMEFNHMTFHGQHHHTKLFVSYEGENQGANIPLGLQLGINFLSGTEFVNFKIQLLNYLGNRDMSKELLTYFYEETPSVTYGTQDQHEYRDLLLEQYDLLGSYPGSKQIEKFGYAGYPAFTRNVSVSNGSRTSTPFDGSFNNVPFTFFPGHTLLHKETSLTGGFLWRRFLVNTSNTGVNQIVFRRTYIFLLGAMLDIKHMTTNIDVLDNAPGGFMKENPSGHPQWIMNQAFNIHYFPGIVNQSDPKVFCFTPAISTHAILNYDRIGNNYIYNYDLQDNNLMFNSFVGLSTNEQSDFFGYPHLGHPTNHYGITPFDALFSARDNTEHVNMVDNGGQPVPHQVQYLNFILNEIEPYNIYLQNRQIGWNADGISSYRADFEAGGTIYIGEQVTPKTDVKPFEIWNHQVVNCTAGEAIIMMPGFYAQAGAIFSAQIESPNCIFIFDNKSMSSSIVKPETKKTMLDTVATMDENKLTTNFNLKIFPNPTNNEFQLYVDNYTEPFHFKVLDLSGKLINESWYVNNGDIIGLNLENGVYVIVVNCGERSISQKLIIN